MSNLAPIIIFAFNRLEPLRACVSSLQRNKESIDSELFVFVDGPRPEKNGEQEKVETIREYVKGITGFKSLHFFFSEENKGLASSIIAGVTTIISEYGKVIVIEDDLILAPSFLCYMNQMLCYFESDSRIFQISGYSSLISDKRKFNSDIYMNARGQCWSWGTWADRWQTIDWNVSDFEDFKKDKRSRKQWKEVGHDLFGMLNSWKKGKLNSWWIRFSYNMYRKNKYVICPMKSLVVNDGFGVDSTHCNAYDRYKVEFDNQPHASFFIPTDLKWNRKFNMYATRYWSLPYRIYGKIITYSYIIMRKKF